MAYSALYRKCRPRLFADVIGQAHIVQTLTNQIVSARVSHAYLFCGTRGTGKTSTAKIFAKAVNCENNLTGEPCNVCPSCENIANGRSLGVVEIDAASNNGVDNIRDIRDEVKYAPTEGKYRIYIIDEVHMLSTGAFNALLKTLEEPPGYVVFILATTDPQKIPATVLSRVQRFDFRRIRATDMVDKIKHYMLDEHVDVDDDALLYIANLSDGAMRDALSILDQCIGFYYGQPITLEKVLEIVGAVDKHVLFDLLDALANYNSATCLTLIDDFIANGRDVGQFVNDLIDHCRNLLMALNIKLESAALNFSAETIQALKTQADTITQPVLLTYVQAFSLLQVDIKYAANQRVLLEVACLKLCNPQTATPNDQTALLQRLQKLEADVAKGVHFPPAAAKNSPSLEPLKEKATQPIEKAVPEDIQAVITQWQTFTACFSMPLKQMLTTSTPCYLEGAVLNIVTKDLSSPLILKEKHEPTIQAQLIDQFKKEFQLTFITQDDYQSRHKRIYGGPDTLFSEKTYTDLVGSDNITFNN